MYTTHTRSVVVSSVSLAVHTRGARARARLTRTHINTEFVGIPFTRAVAFPVRTTPSPALGVVTVSRVARLRLLSVSNRAEEGRVGRALVFVPSRKELPVVSGRAHLGLAPRYCAYGFFPLWVPYERGESPIRSG